MRPLRVKALERRRRNNHRGRGPARISKAAL